jgi:hypothetical protein
VLSGKAGKKDRQLGAKPQQSPMSHLPRNTALFNDEPSSIHPPATPLTRSHSVQRLALNNLKTVLKGNFFASREEIQKNMTAGITAIPTEDFQQSFPQRQDQSRNRACAEEAFFDNNQYAFYYKLCQSSRNFLILPCIPHSISPRGNFLNK